MALNIPSIRQQFPFFRQTNPPVYLDSAATAQMPECVLDAMDDFHRSYRSNVHRGMHALAERATEEYEAARRSVQRFVNARHPVEIVFTKNCTEAVNLVAKTWGRANLRRGDSVVLSILEHHSNIVPWLQLKEEMGIAVHWIDIDADGRLRMDQLASFIETEAVKMIAVTAQSNVLGVRPDLGSIAAIARAADARFLVDAAQLAAHDAIDVMSIDCDFLAFSGHKIYGPTGIGVLYAKRELLEEMPPFLGGGMMIRDVRKDGFVAADIPAKFEAGTPPIAEAIGLRAAIDWLSSHAWDDVKAHERSLTAAAFEMLTGIEGISVLGPKHPEDTHSCISFAIDGIHPHDLTDILGTSGIALRAGHHCAQPLHHRLGIVASTRLSVGMYNEQREIELLAPAIRDARQKLTGKERGRPDLPM